MNSVYEGWRPWREADKWQRIYNMRRIRALIYGKITRKAGLYDDKENLYVIISYERLAEIEEI